jgi:hypothetical protein
MEKLLFCGNLKLNEIECRADVMGRVTYEDCYSGMLCYIMYLY